MRFTLTIRSLCGIIVHQFSHYSVVFPKTISYLCLHVVLLQYQGCSSEDVEITWFWNVVWQLKEEEKALLMKFSTGSPCVPIGGFAALTVSCLAKVALGLSLLCGRILGSSHPLIREGLDKSVPDRL